MQAQREAVKAGVVDVDDQDGGIRALQQPVELLLAGRGADGDHVGRGAEDRLEAGADRRMVVEHGHADECGRWRGGTEARAARGGAVRVAVIWASIQGRGSVLEEM